MPEHVTVARSTAADLQALAHFTAQLDIGAIPGQIVRRAQAYLLYGLSVGVAGATATSPHLAARALDAEHPGVAGPATRLVDGRRTSASAAAFANAVLMHARTQEDAHPAGHVGVVIVPAAMAVAEHAGASAGDLLAAIVAGYEVALRIGRDHVADASSRGLRSTPMYGVFGAAAAAARLLRLDAQRSMHALALAANAAGGLREFVNAGTDEFPFHAGFAARNGITAAFLAQAGVTAASTTLGGTAGFFRAFGEADKDYGRRIADRLGEAFELLDVTYKPYPTCQFHRSVIRGVLALRDRLADRELQSMQIRMHPFEADFFGVRYAGPYSSFSQTFMSAPYCAALAWTAGAVTYRGLHDFDAPELLRNALKVEVIADPSRPRYMPRIALRGSDAREHAWEEHAGAQGYRLTWQAAEDMTRTLCDETGVPGNLTSKLTAAADRLAGGGKIQAVVDACRAAIGAAGSTPLAAEDRP